MWVFSQSNLNCSISQAAFLHWTGQNKPERLDILVCSYNQFFSYTESIVISMKVKIHPLSLFEEDRGNSDPPEEYLTDWESPPRVGIWSLHSNEMAGTRFGRSQESGEAVAGVCALAGVATVVAAIANVFEWVSSVLSGVLAVLTGVSCLVANFSQEGLAFMWSFTPVRGMLGSPWPSGSAIVVASQFLESCFFSTFSQWHTVNCLHPLPMHRMQGNCGKVSLMQSRHWDAVRRGRLLMQLWSNVNCTELLQLLLLLLQLRFTTIVSSCAISAY